MNLLETLKEIILDNQKNDVFTGVPRDVKIIPVSHKAAICIGVRRCGKTTLLAQRIADVKTSYGKENVLSLNFFDDRLTEVRDGQLYLVLEAYYALYPQKKRERIFCFFDELQECTGWEPFVDRLLRDEDVEVYITGSSAKMLSTEIATQMRGRSLTWELFPFSFTEYVDSLKISTRKINSETRYLLQNAFETYYECGGFPEVHKVDKRTRVKIHQEYYKAILHRDVIERFDAIHPKAVMQIAYRLISSVSSLYTLNRVTEYLKSLGYKLSKEFVTDCISWFEDAYFLFTVRKYDKSISKQNLNAKKIYCIDHSLVAS
jgi:predicted AAA+ superfamily ATPase